MLLSAGAGCLRSLTVDEQSSTQLIGSFTDWRRNNQFPFLKLFNVTNEGTALWVKSLLDKSDRVLFIIEYENIPVGHIGFADFGNGIEVCDVVRGAPTPKGLMTSALDSFLNWGHLIGMNHFQLHVATDATSAIRLYHGAGFTPCEIVPLRKHINDKETAWRRTDLGPEYWDRFLLHMELNTKTVK